MKNNPSSEAAHGAGFVFRLITNPIYGAIAGACSIIAIPLTIYFFLLSRAAPNLSYYVSPTRAAIVSTRDASNIEVQFNGQQIKGDLSAALVTIWNAGRKPILRSDILSPITLHVGNGNPILEAKIANETRPLIGFKIHSRDRRAGLLQFTWRILEQNDGAQIQVIYQGDTQEPIFINGAVIGEHEPTKISNEQLRQLNSSATTSSVHQFIWTSSVTIILAILTSAFAIFSMRRRKQTPVIVYVVLASSFGGGIFLSYLVWKLLSTAPPFGF